MSAYEIVSGVIRDYLPLTGLIGFSFATGVSLFAWMVRQPYRIFRSIVGVDVK